MKGIGMVNQQKGVQQETAYSVVVVNVSPSMPIYTCLYDPIWVKYDNIYRDGDT